jgi:hypothetical protein
VPTLLTLGGRAWKDGSQAFRVDVERQECQRHRARVSPQVHGAEWLIDQRAGCLGVQLTFDRVCARSRDNVIERRAPIDGAASGGKFGEQLPRKRRFLQQSSAVGHLSAVDPHAMNADGICR